MYPFGIRLIVGAIVGFVLTMIVSCYVDTTEFKEAEYMQRCQELGSTLKYYDKCTVGCENGVRFDAKN